MNRLVPADHERLTRFSTPVLSKTGAAAWVRYFWQDDAWQRRVELCRDGKTILLRAGGKIEKDPAFSPDGGTLWFLSDGRLAAHTAFGGQTRLVPAVPDGFEAVDVLPLRDGCLLICRKEVCEMPPEGCDWAMPRVTQELRFRSDADHGFKKHYVWRLYRFDGAARLIREADGPFSCPALLPDESAVLYAAGGSFRLLSLPDGEETALPSFRPAGGDIRPVVSADGTYALAAVRSEGEETVLRRLWLDGRDHGPDEPVSEPAGLFCGAYMDLSPDRKTLLSPCGTPDTYFACCAEDHTPGLWRVTVSPGRLVWEKTAFPGLITEAAGEDAGGILVLCGDGTRPPEPVRLSSGGQVRLCPSPNAWLSGADTAPYERVRVPSQDGRAELSAFLLLPKAPIGRVPLLVWVHGGPSGYWAPGFDLELQCAVSKGFAVLLPNPRGSTGRGNAYADPEHVFDGGAANDILCLLDEALRTHPCLDKAHVSVLGGSYGGFMTAWLSGTTSRFCCAVVVKAVTNWLFIHFNSSQAGQPVFDDYRDFQDFLVDTVKASPVYYAQDVRIPTLIIHGEKDQQVPAENAHQYYTALKDCHPDLPVRLMLLPDACHRIQLDPLPAWLAVQRETLAWLDRYGKGEEP